MGRPERKAKREKLSESSRDVKNLALGVKEKLNRSHKKRFKSFLGNSSAGHGHAGRRLVLRFQKKMERKRKHIEEEPYKEPKPLAEDIMISFCTSSNLSNNKNTTSEDSIISTASSFDNTKSSELSLLSKKKKKKPSKHLKIVEVDYQAIQEERKKKYEEIQKNQVLFEETLAKSFEKRRKITKKLTKRTKKGQPVMANQLQNILDKLKTPR